MLLDARDCGKLLPAGELDSATMHLTQLTAGVDDATVMSARLKCRCQALSSLFSNAQDWMVHLHSTTFQSLLQMKSLTTCTKPKANIL